MGKRTRGVEKEKGEILRGKGGEERIGLGKNRTGEE